MALNVNEVAALRERIARALASDRITAFEQQFLSSHEARLEQHGTHAMITEDQRHRMDRIFRKADSRQAGGPVHEQETHPRETAAKDDD